MITKTCTLHHQMELQIRQLTIQLNDCIKAEFPPGTKVQWIHTFERATGKPIYRTGFVVETSYNACIIRIGESQARHRIVAHLLDILP